MPERIAEMLAGFRAPLDIPTAPASLLWMFPLLISIAIVYKATRLRVLFWRRFFLEVLVLFLTLSGFMILAGVVLNLLVWLITR